MRSRRPCSKSRSVRNVRRVTRVLSVDIGTSSARAQLYGDGAEALGPPIARMPHVVDADGELPLEPIVRFVEAALRAAGEVDAVAWSTLWHSLVVLDDRDRPLTELSTWLDRRAARDAEALAQEVDAAAVHARTGAPLHPSFWPVKLRRLRREGIRFARVAALGDYLRLRFEGELATSISLASGSGLFDVHALRWDHELAAALGVDPGSLPPVSERGVWLGDGAAANVGAGCADGRPVVTVGTSAALRVVRGAATAAPGLFLYRLDRSRYVQGGALSDGGSLLTWLSRVAGGEVMDALDRPPGRVAFLPQLGGERSPGWRADARGAIAGLSAPTATADIVQAAFEGITYRLALIWDLAKPDRGGWLGQARSQSQVVQVRELVATGAALVSRPGWAQLIADAFGIPVAMASTVEASARGAAMIALGLDHEPLPPGRRFEPRPERTAQHAQARARLEALYRATASA